jgi:hypothetical protein
MKYLSGSVTSLGVVIYVADNERPLREEVLAAVILAVRDPVPGSIQRLSVGEFVAEFGSTKETENGP